MCANDGIEIISIIDSYISNVKKSWQFFQKSIHKGLLKLYKNSTICDQNLPINHWSNAPHVVFIAKNVCAYDN
jgi:hypothetical protein